MAFRRPGRRQFQSSRSSLKDPDYVRRFNARSRFNAAAAGVEPKFLIDEPPPKRQYTKRTDGSSEHKEQCAVIEWWRQACGVYQLPAFALYAIPNGAYLASGYMGAAKLKAEGMRPGMLDLCLAVPRHGSHGKYIEMKYGKNRPSVEQNTVAEYLKFQGYSVSFHWDADSAINSIKEYLDEQPI
jgi:hypothetical protein